MENTNNQEIEIDLRELFLELWEHIIIICLAAAIGAMAMFYVSDTFMAKKFQSTTKIYVLNQQEEQSVTYTDLQTGTQLSKDYAVLIKSRTVTNQVIADLDLQHTYEDMENITPDQLAEMISVTAENDTRILSITVTDTDPTRAQDIANAVRVAASTHIYEVMDIEAVNVVDYANLPEGRISPNLIKNAIIGGLLGFVVACAIVVVRFLIDDTIKTPDDVEKYLGLSVLASIPFDENADPTYVSGGKKKKRKKGKKATSGKRQNIPTIKNM